MNGESSVVRDTFVKKGLEQLGYSIIPSFLGSEMVEQLKDFFFETLKECNVDSDFFTTHWSDSKIYRNKVDLFVRKILLAEAGKYFTDYNCLLGYYLYKKHSKDNRNNEFV